MPTASGFTMDQGNFKFSLLFPICSVLCLSPLLRQTMTEVSAQNLGVGWRSGKEDFPFSERYHSPWGLFCQCRTEGPSPHLAAHQGRNKACPCFKSKHVFLVEADDSRVSAVLQADSGSNPRTHAQQQCRDVGERHLTEAPEVPSQGCSAENRKVPRGP